MNYVKLALSSVAGIAFAASASAQTVGIGSTKAGAVSQITATISKAVSGSMLRAFRCANRLWVERNSISRNDEANLSSVSPIFLSTIWLAMARVCRREPNTKT